LKRWYKVTKSADWKAPGDVVQTFGSADPNVRVASGRTVVVFNIAGNKYRLVATIHYARPKVFVHRVMTNKEYGEGRWKGEL
jgi:mRNA interferase HigB